MSNLKKTKNRALLCTIVSLITMFIVVISYFTYQISKLPSSFNMSTVSDFNLQTKVPLSVNIEKNDTNYKETSLQNSENHYNAQIKLFSVIPIKEVSLKVAPKQYVTVDGSLFGLQIFSKGVIVVGFTDVDTKNGNKNPAVDAGLISGDIITKVDNVEIISNSQIGKIFSISNGKSLALEVVRENKTINLTIKPEKSLVTNEFKAGIWVKDSASGIGTVTFKMDSGDNEIIAGLGHGVCVSESPILVPIKKGEIMPVELAGVTKGERGTPGQIIGYFTSDEPIGTLSLNCDCGVYGCNPKSKSTTNTDKKIEVALKQDVKVGKAQVLTTIEKGNPQYYDIEIEKVDYNENIPTKNITIKITDSKLLTKTGGIVQGMSGSPIIQNGKLVGAVTHVFVNDQQRGYAIFAETMLEKATNQQVN